MRVQCKSIEEFIANLKTAHSVFDAAVWVLVVESRDEPDSPRVDLALMASAVAVTKEGAEYLVDAEELCGSDYHEGNKPEKDGTKRTDVLMTRLKKFADSRGWSLRPGVLNV